jgi:hypothetical protein
MVDSDVRQYIKRLWSLVVLRMLLDTAAALFVLVLVSCLATVLIAVSGTGFRLSFWYVRRAAAIVGCVYLFVIWARTLWRHWFIAGQSLEAASAVKPEGTEAINAQPTTSSH